MVRFCSTTRHFSHADLETRWLRLQLGYAHIGADGAGRIAEALKSNVVLTELSLRSNGITAFEAGKLAEALKINQVLTSLQLH
jgi:hypothetical protein